MTAVLTVEHLYKSWGDISVLEDISFSVSQGQVLALLGGSGGGKSTLLECINFLAMPNAGKITLQEDTVEILSNKKFSLPSAYLESWRSRIGMVFQQFHLWQHLTVLENVIAAPVHVLKKTRKESIIQAKSLLEKVGILEKKDVYPQQLSGGQQQRVAIARALAMNPLLILFDEPTSALDPQTIVEIISLIKALAQEGKTMIIATHELKFAQQVASHVLFLDNHKMLEYGPITRVFQNPQSNQFEKFISGVDKD